MSNSPLVNYTKISPNRNSPRNTPIRKITIHHMAGNLSVETCGNLFASGGREASSNYGIGSDGRVGMYVEEKDRAWTSSNKENDYQAVTIEVANDQINGDWHVSDVALAKLIDLCEDICRRNNISKLNYTGTTSGNLTRHNMFKATACPGPYLQSKFPYIADEVNKRLASMSPTPTEPPVNPPQITDDTIKLAVKHAAEIIYANEGNYGSVNKNDNGALSIGKVQWHASRALSLLKTVCARNTLSKSILGSALYLEILNASTSAWNNRTVTTDEAAKISTLLLTSEGKQAQDELALYDITSYVNKGISQGLKDVGALIYYADGINQYGSNSSLWKQIVEEALKTSGDVTAMWVATKKLTTGHLSRRERVYNKIVALNLGGSTPVPSVPEVSTSYVVKVTANTLNVRAGAGTNYPITATIKDKGQYTIVGEASGSGATKWGKLKSGVGWISLDYVTKK